MRGVMIFLSTPSARRATFNYEGKLRDFLISIHALREEGDVKLSLDYFAFSVFLSTPSARRATRWNPGRNRDARISIHALREEGDASATPTS